MLINCMYFEDKEIWKCGSKYTDHQGKYPVIFLTFKDVKFDSWQATFAKITELIQEELRDWYDGYLFGSKEIYNPWSVINYISRGCMPQAYWVNSGKNEILEDVLKTSTSDVKEKLRILLQCECVVAKIDENVVYRLLTREPEPGCVTCLYLIVNYNRLKIKVMMLRCVNMSLSIDCQ